MGSGIWMCCAGLALLLGSPAPVVSESAAKEPAEVKTDTDGNGLLDLAELERLYANAEDPSEKAKEAMQEFDADKDGMLNEEEFVNWRGQDPDTDESGGLNLEELINYFKTDSAWDMEPTVASDVAKEALKRFDEDKNDELSNDEFLKFVDDVRKQEEEADEKLNGEMQNPDKDESGALNARELHLHFTTYGGMKGYTVSQAHGAIKEHDTDNNQELDADEFQAYIEAMDKAAGGKEWRQRGVNGEMPSQDGVGDTDTPIDVQFVEDEQSQESEPISDDTESTAGSGKFGSSDAGIADDMQSWNSPSTIQGKSEADEDDDLATAGWTSPDGGASKADL